MVKSVEMWLLDAKPSASGVILSLYSEPDRRVVEKKLDIPFRGFLRARNPESVARELVDVGLAERAWVEEWYSPPYYLELEKLVVFEVRSLSTLKQVLREGSRKGLEPVNTFPHPLVDSLYTRGLRPMTKVSVGKSVEPLEWDPTHRDPELDTLRVYVDGGRYVLEVAQGLEYFDRVKDLAFRISSSRYHVGVVSGELYFRLVEEEPSVSSSAHSWIIGEPHTASEYFEWSRLSYTPLSLMSNTSIGRVLTTVEALEARSRRYFTRRSTRRAESFRSLDELLLYDRGGVIYQPSPGLYWSVCQVDFRSLYPSIMVKYNVSGETVNAPVCSTQLELDWVPHRVCLDREGIVPSSIRRILWLKKLYEDLYRSTGLKVYDSRRKACKWVLVASFGYLGYRNSLFGSISAHEVVTSSSRYVVTLAKKTAERLGYTVVHALVDSVFVSRVPSERACSELSEEIASATSFETKVEAYYTWLYIPKKTSDSRGASNRYLGRLSSGEVKVKGLLCVKRDTPQIVKKAQLEAIAELARSSNQLEMLTAVARATEVIERYIAKVSSGSLEISELLINRGSSHRRSSYVRPPNYAIHGGGPPYVLYASRQGLRKYPQEFKNDVDTQYYVKLLKKALSELPSKNDVASSKYS
ncbi:MAG: DNA polymerase domain-containing protein [Sulfolobales archaeon]